MTKILLSGPCPVMILSQRNCSSSTPLCRTVAPAIKSAFAALASKEPEKIALVFNGRPITYGELHTMAGRLARKILASP